MYFGFCLLVSSFRTDLEQISSTFSKTYKYFLCPEVMLTVGALLSHYTVLRVSMQVMFESEHTLCSKIQYVRTCTAFTQLA